jgi:hypothetical protein
MERDNDTNPRHAANRFEMAMRIGDYLRKNGKQYATAAAARDMGPDQRGLISGLAGESRVPSDPTWACVVRYLEILEAKDMEVALTLSLLVATGEVSKREANKVLSVLPGARTL